MSIVSELAYLAAYRIEKALQQMNEEPEVVIDLTDGNTARQKAELRWFVLHEFLLIESQTSSVQ